MSKKTDKSLSERYVAILERANELDMDLVFTVIPRQVREEMGFERIFPGESDQSLGDSLSTIESLMHSNDHLDNLAELISARKTTMSLLTNLQKSSQNWIRQLNALDEQILEAQSSGFEENVEAIRDVHRDSGETPTEGQRAPMYSEVLDAISEAAAQGGGAFDMDAIRRAAAERGFDVEVLQQPERTLSDARQRSERREARNGSKVGSR